MARELKKHGRGRQVRDGLGSISRMWTRPIPEDRGRPQKVTEGVPMVQLVKRKLATRPEIVMLSKTRSISAERFRRLKTILTSDESNSPQVIVVTSAGPEEGKSFVAINLALALATDRRGQVLLVDADLRRPTVEHWVTPPPKLGLSELLTGQTELDHTVLELENSPLKILPAGTPPPDPVELLSSDYAHALIGTLRERFLRVVIDTPPNVPFTDADAIGGLCDGVLVVVRAGVTRRSTYLQSIASITSTRILGIVLNDLTYSLADRDSYHAYERGYHEYYEKEREP